MGDLRQKDDISVGEALNLVRDIIKPRGFDFDQQIKIRHFYTLGCFAPSWPANEYFYKNFVSDEKQPKFFKDNGQKYPQESTVMELQRRPFHAQGGTFH